MKKRITHFYYISIGILALLYCGLLFLIIPMAIELGGAPGLFLGLSGIALPGFVYYFFIRRLLDEVKEIGKEEEQNRKFGLFGVQGRIETLFRIYKAAKQKLPNATEKELLGIVAGEYIPPGKSTQLRNLGMSGEKYIDDVFESKLPNINELIYRIITLEFPKKYKRSIDLEEIREQIRTGKQSPRDELKTTIKKCHEKFI